MRTRRLLRPIAPGAPEPASSQFGAGRLLTGPSLKLVNSRRSLVKAAVGWSFGRKNAGLWRKARTQTRPEPVTLERDGKPCNRQNRAAL